MAETTTISIADIDLFKRKALHWANQFNVLCLLDSNHYKADEFSRLDWVLAVDSLKSDFQSVPLRQFSDLPEFLNHHNQTVYGFLSYDLKNEFEDLESKNEDHLHFPLLYFFQPRFELKLTENKLTVNRNYPETFELYERIMHFEIKSSDIHKEPIILNSRCSKEDFISNVHSIKEKITAGDFYELNYCYEFYQNNTHINPIDVFLLLNKKAKAPFSSFFKLNSSYLLCASPERFLQKNGRQLVSQPIKGTIRKGVNSIENTLQQEKLKDDLKERAENVMIVDLVRNDLAKSSVPGSVLVNELFGIYEFETVNHMISTIVSEAQTQNVSVILQNAFPMGSMTGAPKVEVMKNIDSYENFKRGLFSGSVGYISPGENGSLTDGNFDFNVVIRSILYNKKNGYLSVPVGGAITFDSLPENEWEEVLLKANAMVEVLKKTSL